MERQSGSVHFFVSRREVGTLVHVAGVLVLVDQVSRRRREERERDDDRPCAEVGLPHQIHDGHVMSLGSGRRRRRRRPTIVARRHLLPEHSTAFIPIQDVTVHTWEGGFPPSFTLDAAWPP